MFGIVLLIVGAVLLHNGVCMLSKSDGRATSVINIMGGLILFILYMLMIIRGYYLYGSVGMLVAVLYIYIGITNIFNLDLKPLGWYSLFVAISMIPMSVDSLLYGDTLMAILWWMWIVLLSTMFVEESLGKDLKNTVSYMCLFMSVFTGLLPGYLLLFDAWVYF